MIKNHVLPSQPVSDSHDHEVAPMIASISAAKGEIFCSSSLTGIIRVTSRFHLEVVSAIKSMVMISRMGLNKTLSKAGDQKTYLLLDQEP